MNGPLLQLRAWQWTRTCMQAATLLLLALALDWNDYGRYVTAVAIASCLAPFLVSGPAVVYHRSHAAFGSTREQIATLWTRTLIVVGAPCAMLVAALMAAIANDWSGALLWVGVGVAEIVMLGYVEMRACYEYAQGRESRMVIWQALPHALRLIAVLAILSWSVVLTLPVWVAISLAATSLVACAAYKVPRKSAPRSWDAVRRLVRVGFRYGSGGTANRVLSDGDKPIVMRAVDPTMTGALFLAQRVVDLVCFPLQASIASALPGLLEANATERRALWRHSWWKPAAYAVIAGAALYALSFGLRTLGPEFDTPADVLAWLCWFPLVDFARGMFGNAAIVAGRGEAFTNGLWLGAIVRLAAALVLVAPFGWQGAVGGLLLAELTTLAYLMISTWRRAEPRTTTHVPTRH